MIGNVTYYDSSGQNEYQFDKPYSESTAQIIDQEISKLIEIQYERAKKILQENKDQLTRLAEDLLKKEVIFKENLESIFGKRKWLTAEEKLQASLNEEADIDASPKKKTNKNTDENRDSELILDEQQEND